MSNAIHIGIVVAFVLIGLAGVTRRKTTEKREEEES